MQFEIVYGVNWGSMGIGGLAKRKVHAIGLVVYVLDQKILQQLSFYFILF